ncbi:MAG: hypothetical protein FP814_15700 [Desulfobacterium sp.]|nr:hypothetical protein [Desulfobacterium sp.]
MKICICSAVLFLFAISSNNLDCRAGEIFYKDQKQFLKDNLQNKKDMYPRIVLLYPPELFWINDLKLYGVFHTLAKDPVPAPNRFIRAPDGSIYHASEIRDILTKLEIYPRSNDEAIKYSALITYCMNRNDHTLKQNGLLYGEYEKHVHNRNTEAINKLSKRMVSKIKDPESEQKDNCFIVTFYVNTFESHEYWDASSYSISKKTVRIGKDVYEIIKDKKIKTIDLSGG